MREYRLSRRDFVKFSASLAGSLFLSPLFPILADSKNQDTKNNPAPKETDIFDNPLSIVDKFREHPYLQGSKLQKEINELLGDGEESKENRVSYQKGYEMFKEQIKDLYSGAKDVYKIESPNGIGVLDKIPDFWILHRHLTYMRDVLNSKEKPSEFVNEISDDLKTLTQMFAPAVKYPLDMAAASEEYNRRASESMNNKGILENLNPKLQKLVDKVVEVVPRAFVNVAKIELAQYDTGYYVDDRRSVRLKVDPDKPDLAIGEIISGLSLLNYPGWTGSYPRLIYSHPQDLLDLGRITLDMYKEHEKYFKGADIGAITDATLLEPEASPIIGRARYIDSSNVLETRSGLYKLSDSIKNLSVYSHLKNLFSASKGLIEVELEAMLDKKHVDSPFFINADDLVRYLETRDEIKDIRDSINESDHIKIRDLKKITANSLEDYARLVKEVNDPDLKDKILEKGINIENVNFWLIHVLSRAERMVALASMPLGPSGDSLGYTLWYEKELSEAVYRLMQPLGIGSLYGVGSDFTLEYPMTEYKDELNKDARTLRTARNAYTMSKFGKTVYDQKSVAYQEKFMELNILAIKAHLRIMGVEKGAEEAVLASLSSKNEGKSN